MISLYESIFWIWGVLTAVVTFFLCLKVVAPYGRHAKNNWGPMIDNKLGWIFMELPALICFPLLMYLFVPIINTPMLICIVLFIIHYINRIFIYPLRIKTKGKKMPLVIAIMAVVFNLINGWYLKEGYLNSSYNENYIFSFQFIFGFILFIFGFIVNNYSDTILISLRKDNSNEYKIPYGGFFKYVSCGNLFGEIVEWLGFAIMVSNLGGWSFFIWTFANLAPRAYAHHNWYLSKFQDYPKDRKAVIPFIW